MKTMTNAQMAKCFNEWMRRYIEDPDRFKREFQTVHDFLQEEAEGREPTYGEVSAAYMNRIARDCPVA